MVRPKTTKELAERIDPLYVRHRSAMSWFRLTLSIGFVVTAVALWVYAGLRKRDTVLLLPGPVSAAHAMWQNDCAKCHVTEGKLIVRAAVSDEACLKCHNAPPHDRNQLLRAGIHEHSDLAFAFSDAPDKKTPTRSAACTACHVEHKSRARLTAIDDANCTRCHKNIAVAVESSEAIRTVNVDAFNDTGAHPYFGGVMAQGGALARPTHNTPLASNALWDPKRVKFSHKRHLALSNFAPPAGMKDNCILCHKPIQPSTGGDVQNRQPIQFATQVNYDAQCRSCHPLTLSTGLPIPHVGMDIVENRLGDLDAMYKAWFATLTSDRRDEITSGEPATWLASLDGGRKPRVEADTWLKTAQVDKLDSASQLAGELQAALNKGAAGDVRVLPLFVAFGMGKSTPSTSCATCHEFKKSAAATTQPSDLSAPATTKPSMPGLRTEPTGMVNGMPDTRRWFTKSTFDHRSHQTWACTECHVAAPAFQQTPDMLPNLIWTRENGAVTSCVVCHHATSREQGRGARASCVTCHVYHDHSQPTVPAKLQDWPDTLSLGDAKK